MKDLINCMKIMYGILEKNKGLIIDQKLSNEDQLKAFSVVLYIDMEFEMLIHSSINVAPFGQTLFVGLHSNVKGVFNNIYLTFDQLNKLCMAFDEAEKEFTKLNADLKSKRKLKTGILVQPDGLEYQIHEKIEKQCGRSFK